MIGAVLLMVAMALIMVLLTIWTRDLADLLWMFVARPILVGAISSIAMITMLLTVGTLLGVAPDSPTAFAVAFLVTPTIAKWSTNGLAWSAVRYRLSGDPEALKQLPRIGSFLFAQRRKDQATAYEAPRVAP